MTMVELEFDGAKRGGQGNVDGIGQRRDLRQGSGCGGRPSGNGGRWLFRDRGIQWECQRRRNQSQTREHRGLDGHLTTRREFVAQFAQLAPRKIVGAQHAAIVCLDRDRGDRAAVTLVAQHRVGRDADAVLLTPLAQCKHRGEQIEALVGQPVLDLAAIVGQRFALHDPVFDEVPLENRYVERCRRHGRHSWQ